MWKKEKRWKNRTGSMCWWWSDFELFFRNHFFLYSVFFTFPSLSLFCIVVLREILLSRSVHFKITHSIHYTDFIASISKWFFSHFNISLHIIQLILFTAKYIFFLKNYRKTNRNQWFIYVFFLLATCAHEIGTNIWI